MSDSQIQPGGSPIPNGDLVAVDNLTVFGDGSVQHPLRSINGAGATGPTGPAGPTGSIGPTGPKGATGAPGSGDGFNRRIFTTSGTYTPTPGITRVHVQMCGGGGAGGGAPAPGGPPGNSVSVGGGGGSAAGLDFYVTGPITGGAVVVGTGQIGTIATDGGSGTDTTVIINAVTYKAKRGTGGHNRSGASAGFPNVAANGGPATGSSVVAVVNGDLGQIGIGLATIIDLGAGGNGGSGSFGIGGVGQITAAGNGSPGTGNGSGGGGALATGVTDQASGSGTDGIVIIDEYT